VLSHGVRSHDWQMFDQRRTGQEVRSVEDHISDKEQEVIDGAKELGITDVRFLKHEDDIVLIREDTINDIADVIQDVRPDIIITHFPYESVPAHANCAQMTLLAIDAAAGVRKSGDASHRVAQIFYTALAGRTNVLEGAFARIPSLLVDISDVAEQKLKAIRKLESQYYSGPLGRKVLEVFDGFYGIHARVPYVEAFIPHKPEVYPHLVVSDFNLDITEKSSADAFAYSTRMLDADV